MSPTRRQIGPTRVATTSQARGQSFLSPHAGYTAHNLDPSTPYSVPVGHKDTTQDTVTGSHQTYLPQDQILDGGSRSTNFWYPGAHAVGIIEGSAATAEDVKTTPSMIGTGSSTFSEDNLGWGEQFGYVDSTII